MEKISIKLEPALRAKLEDRMERKRCASLSQCARELMELAIRIEELSDKNDEKDGSNAIDPTLLALVKTHLECALETKLLLRYLLKNPDAEAQNAEQVFHSAKEKSQKLCEEMFGNLSIRVDC